MSGRAARTFSRMRKIGFGRVAAVHRLEDAVAARLHRQMQVGHQLVDLAMGGDQRVGHVRRVAGRVADALEPIDLRQRSDQVGEAAALVRPGIHVLAEQDDLARAGVDQRLRFGDDVVPRPRDFGAARIGHDAIGAEFVAAFLHGEEGARAGAAARRQRVEFADRRHVGVDRPGPARGLARPFRAGGDRPAGRRRCRSAASGAWPPRLRPGRRSRRARSAASIRPRASAGRRPNRPSPPPSRGCGRC